MELKSDIVHCHCMDLFILSWDYHIHRLLSPCLIIYAVGKSVGKSRNPIDPHGRITVMETQFPIAYYGTRCEAARNE